MSEAAMEAIWFGAISIRSGALSRDGKSPGNAFDTGFQEVAFLVDLGVRVCDHFIVLFLGGEVEYRFLDIYLTCLETVRYGFQ